MKIKYCCDYCDEQFDSAATCRAHEILHLDGVEKLKYYIRHETFEDLCSYCTNGYYVYGCELNCNHHGCNSKNNYKDFICRNLKGEI